ncbi:unnamed protein product, partial [Polarella glacialis]
TRQCAASTSGRDKAALATLLTAPQETCAALVGSFSSEVLEAAAALLEEFCEAKIRRRVTSKSSKALCVGGAKGKQQKNQGTGLTQLPTGEWDVKISWRNFSVEAAKPIATLEQASSLHTALIQAREAAKARHRAYMRDLGVTQGNDLEECVPLTQAELWLVLSEEPYPLQFSSDITRRSQRIQHGFTPCLTSALNSRGLVLRFLAKGQLLGQEARTKKLTAQMRDQAKRDKDVRDLLNSELLKSLTAELAFRRRQGVAAAPPKAEEKPLALQDATAAAVNAAVAELTAVHCAALHAVTNAANRDSAEVSRLRDQIHQDQEKLQQKLAEAQRVQKEEKSRWLQMAQKERNAKEE